MKKLLVLFATSLWALTLTAQSDDLPYWVYKLPESSESDNFYYRVTRAEEKTYEKAYAKAFATAIVESSWKNGVTFQTNVSLHELEQDITENLNVESSQMRLAMNKVCEYVEPVQTSSKLRIYVLWQVVKQANLPPKFESFTKCR